MKTQFLSTDPVKRPWHVLDADNAVLGRLASRAASMLMGKHKPTFSPFLDNGDHVIVVNAAKVKVTGRKEDQKVYRRYSGYMGGLSQVGLRKVRATRPERLVEEAIRGMLPKTRLGSQMYRKLHVYAGPQHPHQAQKPSPVAAGA